MRLVTVATAPADPPVARADASRGRRAWAAHLLVASTALLLALWVTGGLWASPTTRTIAANPGDQAFFEGLLGYGVHLLRHGGDPFFTDLLNAPLGVNLAANTSITAYILLFAPLTMLAGPQVSYVTILTLNLACSAFAWYLFLHRHLVRHRAAAALGGLFCGFAPGLVSHANGHLNWTAGWIAPLLLWRVLTLREPGRWLRNGAILGAVVALCFSIAAEGLFFTALASGVFIGAWAAAPATRAQARAAAPTVLAALGVTAAVAGALLAYPLYMHFAGPQTFSGTGFDQREFSEDAAAYLAYPSRSVAGWAGLDRADLASNPTEQASFFGLPLIVLAGFATVTLWRHADAGRRATLRALLIVGAVFTVLSWGPRLRVLDDETHLPLPYATLARLPLFDSALPTRYALVVAGVLGILLALAAEWVLSTAGPRSRAAWAAAFTFALLPLLPLPVLTAERAPEPRFIADGTWREYVPDGGVLSALPFATNPGPDAQRWQAYTLARGGPVFRIPGGYFLGPGGPDGKGQIGTPLLPTDVLLQQAAHYGYLPPITDAEREQARRDFAYWNLQAVFLADRVIGSQGLLFHTTLEQTTTALLGPPERVDDVLVWRIRPGVDPVTPGG
ncbi:hypothetical protein EV385_4717 [Krasilnikovia cinnamomea]|uniref:DUF6311 domain-containing protein n=1 Tax=Krasilnikovia cinnamomea TaxID=349313 RepID=A0A4Q7ZQL1_9ACTN|nr:hypothetical protein EV385_4717 [Krasilnikovia cinnamomea]